MSIKGEIRRVLWKLGYDISRFDPTSHYLARRKKLIELYEIDLILDVGANTGQYAQQIRKAFGFSGRIVSFEPLSNEFDKLRFNADKDSKWDAINCALGSTNERSSINIAGNY
ncbi:MAG: FkbM family methyltransferase [Acidobacteria bacterium]|nr:FkbM family methyltransferase [Acidobacteriota bacterium]